MHAGDVDALLGLDDAVIADRADNVGVADLVNAQLDQTVVQHDPTTGLDIVGQLLVSDGADFVRALYAAGVRVNFWSVVSFSTPFLNSPRRISGPLVSSIQAMGRSSSLDSARTLSKRPLCSS